MVIDGGIAPTKTIDLEELAEIVIFAAGLAKKSALMNPKSLLELSCWSNKLPNSKT